MKTFKEELQQRTETINRELMRFLPEEKGMQKLILEACNYSVENGGKRIRPLLMESAYFLCRLSQEPEACGQAGEPEALRERWREEYETLLAPFMAAIEMIHSSSLVHDDLPCMDNDRLRRGKPSTWARFGEDMGTLAGDGLMIYAFETAVKAMDLRETKLLSASAESREAASMMIRNYTEQAGDRACRVINGVDILARKTGIFGMIGGQTVDVQLTGKTPSEEELSFIYRLKTGALLEAAMMIGGVLAGASEDTVAKLRLSAANLGLAFQIQDDILDETGTEADLGKPVGSDERNQKTTYVTLHGRTQAAEEVKKLTERAEARLREIGDYPFLLDLCAYLIDRRN